MKYSVLYIGSISKNGLFNTSRSRRDALIRLGNSVYTIDTSFISELSYPGLVIKVLEIIFRWINIFKIKSVVKKYQFNLIWIDKNFELVKYVNFDAKVVGYCPDDLLNPRILSRRNQVLLRDFDVYITTKSHNIDLLRKVGCVNPIFVNNCFEEEFLLPPTEYRIKYEVGFIGTYEFERASYLKFLACNGIQVHVWGNGWDKLKHENIFWVSTTVGNNYAEIVSQIRINLNFLRKENRDKQTTRSVELASMNVILFSEYSEEHELIYDGMPNVSLFSSKEELLSLFRINHVRADSREQLIQKGLEYKKMIEQLLNESISSL